MIVVAYVFDAGNRTRPATPAEITNSLGIEACQDDHCTNEKRLVQIDAVGVRKRQNQLNQHREEVNLMLSAGIDINTVQHFWGSKWPGGAHGPSGVDSLFSYRDGVFASTSYTISI